MPQYPYGNAFIISTPKTDRFNALVLQDQRLQEQYERQQNQLLDRQFAQNASAIRDVDIAEASRLFNDYKRSGINLEKNGNRMSNQERIQAQLDNNRKAALYYQHINNSKSEKEPEDILQKDIYKNSSKYDENAIPFLSGRRNVPVNDLQRSPYGDLVSGTQLKTMDLSKNISAAMGKETKRKTLVQDNGLTSTPTDIMGFNSPHQYAQTLAESLPTQRQQEMVIRQHAIPDFKAQDIVTRYNTLKETPEFKAAYPNEPEYTSEDLSDPFKRTVALMSMEHALLHPPKAIVGKPYNNTEDVMTRRENFIESERRKKDATMFRKLAITEAGKNGRLKTLIGGIEIPNVLENGKNAIPLTPQVAIEKGLPFQGDEVLIPLDSYDAREVDDILGKKDQYLQRPTKPIKKDGKEYIIKKDGKYYGDNMKEINPDEVRGSTWSRRKDELKGVQKGIIKSASGTQQPTKSIPRSKIKSLVGTKGYEGYTEDELIKYYEDNGYKVQ